MKINPRLLLFSVLIGVFIVPNLYGQAQSLTDTSITAPNISELFTVLTYDTSRNPTADLYVTLKKAKVNQKRVLIQVGGNWSAWCQAFDQFILANPEIREALAHSFYIMKVNYSLENQNEAFLSNFPTIPGYPHFFILDADGVLLHSQNTTAFEQGKSFNQDAILKFVKKWGL